MRMALPRLRLGRMRVVPAVGAWESALRSGGFPPSKRMNGHPTGRDARATLRAPIRPGLAAHA